MFGIRIISEKEYQRLKECEAIWDARNDVLTEADELLKRDLDSLRAQLSEKIVEIDKLKYNPVNFEDFFTLQINGTKPVKCASCKIEQPECKKYTSGKYSVCVLRKQ